MKIITLLLTLFVSSVAVAEPATLCVTYLKPKTGKLVSTTAWGFDTKDKWCTRGVGVRIDGLELDNGFTVTMRTKIVGMNCVPKGEKC